MKAGVFVVALVALMGCAVPLAYAQPGVVYNYTIHVDFFAYSCSLSISEVSLYDASGVVMGAGSSPYGEEIAISFTTSSPMSVLTATAVGLATWSSYSWSVNGSNSITLGNAGDYWVTVRMNQA